MLLLCLSFVRPTVDPYSSISLLFKCLCLFLLFVQLCKEDREEYIAYLMSIDWLDEAAQKMADIINDDSFVSRKGKSKHQVGSFH